MYIHYITLNSIHGSDFVADRPIGLPDFVFLVIKTASTLIIDNHIYTINNPSAILIDSNTPHKYFPSGSRYIDDYIHFNVSDHNRFLNELTFPSNTPVQISNYSSIENILQSLQNEYRSDSKYSDRITDLLIQILIIRVGEQWELLHQRNSDIQHYSDLLAVRNTILNSPTKVWTIEELAQKAHLSHAYFQVMYKKAFGVTCITDVINAKIAQAKVLLTSTDLPVKEVAQELGYNEVYHFIRQFKKSTGFTPGAFRKKAIL
jgi:AraC family transcriptional regulator of arabinose operon